MNVGESSAVPLQNLRVAVDGEWLCLEEVDQLQLANSAEKDIESASEAREEKSFSSLSSTPQSDQTFTDYNGSDLIVQKSKGNNPSIIEKSNLLNILKLVIKEVLDSGMKYGCQLDSDHVPLQHSFIILEHVLRHGLKSKKGLLSGKRDLWDVFQAVETRKPDVADLITSIRNLPNVKTNSGRARAWIRMAMMQKKLGDYIGCLVDEPNGVLSDHYEPQALLRSEEAPVIVGLILSLNVVDCNIWLKEENLDATPGVIDFSLYLRNKADTTLVTSPMDLSDLSIGKEKLSTVLDQKNYIEEVNRNLTSNMSTLQSKVEGLETMNALMKEDLHISSQALRKAKAENDHLMAQLQRLKIDQEIAAKTNSARPKEGAASLKGRSSAEIEQLIAQRDAIQKELKLQMSMKAEMEMAMKLLEKDVHEKQDVIVNLRDQLDNIKDINLDLYTKLEEMTLSYRHKSDINHMLEENLRMSSQTFDNLEKEMADLRKENTGLVTENLQAKTAIADLEMNLASLKQDFAIQSELKSNFQSHLERSQNQIKELQGKLAMAIAKNEEHIKEAMQVSKERKENEQALLATVDHLAEAKVSLKDLEEKIRSLTGPFGGWQEDKDVDKCNGCSAEFSMSLRKHHCRACGKIFCNSCCQQRAKVAPHTQKVRVCASCHDIIQRWQSENE